MIATDLDGTLLDTRRRVSARDWDTLARLGERGIVRVVATGRSLYSARRVLPDDLPLDYLVYSSGVAALRWPHGPEVFVNRMDAHIAMAALTELLAAHCDFMIQHAAPDTHCFAYSANGAMANPDFNERIRLYAQYAAPLDWSSLQQLDFDVSQFVVVHPQAGGVALWERLRRALPDCNVVRTTSPLDGRSVWVEIFPATVSKASGCAELARRHGIEAADVLGVGNDFNDLDLLDWVGAPFVVANSPPALKTRFPVTATHDESGFSACVEQWLGQR